MCILILIQYLLRLRKINHAQYSMASNLVLYLLISFFLFFQVSLNTLTFSYFKLYSFETLFESYKVLIITKLYFSYSYFINIELAFEALILFFDDLLYQNRQTFWSAISELSTINFQFTIQIIIFLYFLFLIVLSFYMFSQRNFYKHLFLVQWVNCNIPFNRFFVLS